MLHDPLVNARNFSEKKNVEDKLDDAPNGTGFVFRNDLQIRHFKKSSIRK